MNHVSVAEVLARANASLVADDVDVTGAIASVIAGAAEALPADAVALLVESDGVLDLLSATSHQVADLEIYQAQVEEGPCVDTIRLGVDIDVVGAEAIEERWPTVGPLIVQSGYSSVHAAPLTWHGVAFGGLNIFRVEALSLADQQVGCRALADALTLAIVAQALGRVDVAEALRAALEDRAVVEQAKGALGHVAGLDMAAAYRALLSRAAADGVPLGVAAREVMRHARAGTLTESTAR
jgi:hypothetical protein